MCSNDHHPSRVPGRLQHHDVGDAPGRWITAFAQNVRHRSQLLDQLCFEQQRFEF